MSTPEVRLIVEVIVDARRLRREAEAVWPDAPVGAAEERMLFGEAVDRLLRAGAFALQRVEVIEGEVLPVDPAGERLRRQASAGRAYARGAQRR